jgi:hypothetical protein
MADRSQLRYINAGISGTPSVLGITRLEKDVLVHQPDIVFVGFAVNDSNQPVPRIIYESMVRKLLAAPSQPAVVLLFTFTQNGYSCQPHMQQVGKQYDLGMISVKDAIQPQITLGKMKWSDYSSDYAHPTTEAHGFIAEMIGYYFDQAAATAPAPYTMNDRVKYGRILENLRFLSERGCAIEVRYPLVVGYNDLECENIAKTLSCMNGITKVKVLQYHSFSASRYLALNLPNTLPDTQTTALDMENAVNVLRRYGLNAVNGMVED